MAISLGTSQRIQRPTGRRTDKQAASKLRRLRLNQGLSPEQLAAHVGLSGKAIRLIEEGRVIPTPRSMFALAHYFELEVTDLWRL